MLAVSRHAAVHFQKSWRLRSYKSAFQRRTIMSDVNVLAHMVPSDPMFPVLGLAAVQVGMGAFDNLYHHEVTERLPWRTSQENEQRLHALRGALYVSVFGCFAGLTPHGMYAYGIASILIVEIGVTLCDFVNEDSTRHLPPSERITHTLMTLNYGALLALWMPIILNDWALQPTAVVFNNYGVFSPFNALCASAIGLWSVRDWFAAKRLHKFSQEALPSLDLHIAHQEFLILGGTGLLGSRLVRCLLHEGHHVTLFVRDATKAIESVGFTEGNMCGKLTLVSSLKELSASSKYDVVINLAGESIASKRWTKERKRVLWDSRVSLTDQLCCLVSSLDEKPRVFLQGSAIGFYGVEAGERQKAVDEDSAPLETDSFSHQLVSNWEKAASSVVNTPSSSAIRLVYLRTGVVLSREGGAMAQMLTPFEFCLGGPVGDGNQIMSWIHIDDWVRSVAKCINDDKIEGPVNLTSPTAFNTTNKQLASSLGKALGRPAILPMPGFCLKIALGRELADELLLKGCAVKPSVLERHGFQYLYPDIDTALDSVCNSNDKKNC